MKIFESTEKILDKMKSHDYKIIGVFINSKRHVIGLDLSFLDSNEFDIVLIRLPEPVLKLKHLRNLKLNNNSLETLPASICTLSKLESIDLRGNPITSLPDCITSMPSLKEIWLSKDASVKLPRLQNKKLKIMRN